VTSFVFLILNDLAIIVSISSFKKFELCPVEVTCKKSRLSACFFIGLCI